MREEHEHVRQEPGGPRLARCGHMRERERPDAEPDRQDGDEPLQPPRRRDELRREAVEEVGEENEQLDLEPLHGVLQEAVWLRGVEPADRDDDAERQEGEGEPTCGAVPALQPTKEREHEQRHDEDACEDRKGRDNRMHETSPPGSKPGGIVRFSRLLGMNDTMQP